MHWESNNSISTGSLFVLSNGLSFLAITIADVLGCSSYFFPVSSLSKTSLWRSFGRSFYFSRKLNRSTSSYLLLRRNFLGSGRIPCDSWKLWLKWRFSIAGRWWVSRLISHLQCLPMIQTIYRDVRKEIILEVKNFIVILYEIKKIY